MVKPWEILDSCWLSLHPVPLKPAEADEDEREINLRDAAVMTEISNGNIGYVGNFYGEHQPVRHYATAQFAAALGCCAVFRGRL